MRKKNLIIAVSTGFTLSIAVMAEEQSFHQHGAHVHGQVHMSIAMADNELLVNWHAPAGDIFGFEHAPKSTQQSTTIEQELAWLKQVDWLQFRDLASCELQHSVAHTTLLEETHSGHGDIEVTMHWRCDRDVDISTIEIKLFERYEKLESIHYDWLRENQAGSGVLTAPQQQIYL